MGNTAAWDEIGAKVDFPCFYSLEAALRARKRKIDSWGGVLLPFGPRLYKRWFRC